MKKLLVFLYLLLPALLFSQRDAATIAQEVERLRGIYDIVLDPIEQIPSEPTARSLAGGNWGYSFLEVDQVRNLIAQKAKRKVVVFIFDTAGDYDHPDLEGVIDRSLASNWTDETSPADGHGHGTHVAGTVAGKSSLPLGIATDLRTLGLIKLVPVKVLNTSGAGNFSWIDKALQSVNKQAETLIKQGFGVVYNFSLGGGSSCPSTTASLLAAAEKLGVIVCSAAGNSGRDGVGCPAKNSTAVIAAIDQSGAKAGFSTTGAEVRYSAPGVGIYSCLPGGRYAEWSGTSMATPHQSGVFAILLSCFPESTPQAMVQYADKRAKDLGQAGRDPYFGYGVTLLKAMFTGVPIDEPKPPTPEPPAPEPEPQPLRIMQITLPDTFSVIWSRGTENQWRVAKLSFAVEYPTTLEGNTAANLIGYTVRDHFKNLGYIMRPQDDEFDLLYWAAFFFEMSTKGKLGKDARISCAELHVNGVTLHTAYPTKGAKPAKAKKAAKRGEVFDIQVSNAAIRFNGSGHPSYEWCDGMQIKWNGKIDTTLFHLPTREEIPYRYFDGTIATPSKPKGLK